MYTVFALLILLLGSVEQAVWASHPIIWSPSDSVQSAEPAVSQDPRRCAAPIWQKPMSQRKKGAPVDSGLAQKSPSAKAWRAEELKAISSSADFTRRSKDERAQLIADADTLYEQGFLPREEHARLLEFNEEAGQRKRDEVTSHRAELMGFVGLGLGALALLNEGGG